MDNKQQDALLVEIQNILAKKPKNPTPLWYGELTRLLCYAPLKLIAENPTPGSDGHPYLLFELPEKNEIPDQDFSQYTIQEYAPTLIELISGAVVQDHHKETIWSFSIGSLLNLSQERDPYKNTDQRVWGWPKLTPRKKEILRLKASESGLPQEILTGITNFLKGIKPHIKQWGIAICPKAKATTMFIEPSVPIKNADPEVILKHLRWFTPHHFHWEAIDPNQ